MNYGVGRQPALNGEQTEIPRARVRGNDERDKRNTYAEKEREREKENEKRASLPRQLCRCESVARGPDGKRHR